MRKRLPISSGGSERGPTLTRTSANVRLLRDQIEDAFDSPIEGLLKPAIKAIVLIALLTTAAHWVQERSLDRKSLAALATKATSDPVKTGSIKK